MTAITERLSTALAGRYRIERHLGEGGMASVYLCEDLKHDRKVALKLLKPELAAVLGAERFVQEIKTTASLSHPHILPLFDSGTADGFLFYVMPFIKGETLREKLNRETQLGVDEAVRIAREVADALDYAHRNGVIHRDIKPENILVHDGRPMVADFGIALAVSAAAGGRMTETGLSLGTPHYMSPEQATAEKEISSRSDIYSLGSVLYEMLTGEPPHSGGSAQQVIMKIITDRARPVTELRKSVPPNVAAAVAKAIEKLPADRFDSAKAFADALGNPGYTSTSFAGSAAAGGQRRGANLLAGVVAAVVLLAAGVGIGAMLTRPTPAPLLVARFTAGATSGRLFLPTPNFDTPFALSPDGSHIVYVVLDSGASAPRLHVRRLDQLTSTPIPGTERATNPFFSPDGLWIGFVTSTDRVLRKVAATGGPVSQLATNVGLGFGQYSWGDDGFIVYPTRENQIARVHEGGGTPTMLTDSTMFSAAFAPVVLPGARAVLLAGNSSGSTSDGFRGSLYVLDVATRKPTVLVENGWRGWYVPDGYVVYGTSTGALHAVRFDLGKLAVTSAPVALLDGIMTSRFGLEHVAIASQSGTMVYLPERSRDAAVIVQVERTGREQVIVAKPGPYSDPRLSPDGRRIALSMLDAGKNQQIWVHDRSSTTTTQLTFDGQNMRAAWSPDGSRLGFTSRVRGKDYIWSMPADGSSKGERAGEGPEIIGTAPVSWTRDGKWIVTDGVPEDGKGAGLEDIFAIPTSGTRTMQSVIGTPANEQSGEVSPDGEWIAYGSDDSGRNQLYVQPFLTPGGRTLISASAAAEAAWASNNELVYVNTDTDSMTLARLVFGPTITVTRTTLFDHRPFRAGSNSVRAYDVSRDGKEFVFVRPLSQRTGLEPIVVLNWVEEVRRLMAAAERR